MSGGPEKLIVMVLSALQDGPGTSEEIGIELEIPTKTVSAVLSDLASHGLARRTGRLGRFFIYEASV